MKLVRLALALLITVSFVSCSKDKDDNKEGLRVNFDGKNIDLSHYTRAELTKVGDIFSLEILGTDKDSYGNIASFGIASETAITAKKYTHDVNDYSSAVISIGFRPEGDDPDYYYGGLDVDLPFSITIRSISETRVEGSFEGQVELDNVTKNVSGNFNLAIEP